MPQHRADLVLDLSQPAGAELRTRLAHALRTALLDGRAVAGESLPSSRALAAQLGISRGTVVDALDQLVGEGYLVSRPRSGLLVAEGIAGPGSESTRSVSVTRPDASRPPSEPVTRSEEEPRAGDRPHTTIDLSPGSPSTRGVNNAEWRASWRAATQSVLPTVSPEITGSQALRRAIADHLRRSRGVAVEPGDIVVTAGTADAVALVALAAAERAGRPARAVVEDPGYPSVRRRLARTGAEVIGVATDADGLDLDALRRVSPVPDVVVVTPSHQYPLGGRLPIETRRALLDWATDAGVVIVEDDYDSEFRHVGAPLPALASIDAAGVVAHIGSFSKIVSPWLRTAYLVVRAGSPLRPAVDTVLSDLSPTVPGIAQDALAHFLDSGGLRRQLARTRREYHHRRALILSALERMPAVTAHGLDGGLHVVLQFDEEAVPSVPRLVGSLADRGVIVADLADYAVAGAGPFPAIVLGYGNPTDLELTRALDTLRTLLAG